jgi:hypothetical protein
MAKGHNDRGLPDYASINRPVELPGGVSVMRYMEVRTDELVQGWQVVAWIENAPFGPRCIDLRIATNADHPITSDALRRVRVGQLIQFAEDHPMLFQGSLTEGAWATEGGRDRAAYLRARRRQEAQGRRRISDEDLTRVAAVYRAALIAGRPPTAAVQGELRLRTRGQAARWVKRAREEGFLGPAPGRRRPGEASPSHNPQEDE